MYPPFQHQQYSRSLPSVQPPPPPPLSIPQHQTYLPANMPSSTISSASIPPPSPSQSSDVDEATIMSAPGPPPISRVSEAKAWVLNIEQQPMRARMCGFGDKDRRPISPPPCVRLIIVDPDTGLEVDYSIYDNLSRFVLMVDLSNVESSEEKNVVRHVTGSLPAISSTLTAAFTPTVSTAQAVPRLPSYNATNLPPYAGQVFSSPVPTGMVAQQQSLSNSRQANGNNQQGYYPNNDPYSRSAASLPGPRYQQSYPAQYNSSYQLPPAPQPEDRIAADQQRPNTTQLCTRNLIGSLCGSAFKLQNLKGETGLWFVFQDLSIRTEGWFRLKFTFFDLMGKTHPTEPTTDKLSALAPMLACVYSKPFRVFSAKRFPGVIESTELSRKFASQGIKIPIRKDGQKPGDKRKRGSTSEDDEDSGEE